MNNKLLQAIPYIDVGQLLSGAISPTSFLQILHEYGFVYFYNLDTAPLNLNAVNFKQLELYANKFFTLPLDTKMQYYIGNSPNHRGYVPVSEKGAYGDEKLRVYEAFDMSYTTDFKDDKSYQKLMGENCWPEEIKDFKEVCENYYGQMFLLGKSILSILAQSFELSTDYFTEYIKYPPAQLRLINYFKNDSLVSNDDIAMGLHTDYECFTFIYQSSPGIQGYINQNKQFLDLPVFKNSLLMIVGDVLDFMTNSYLKSFLHRVSTNGGKRFSVPFFMNLDFDTKVSILPKFRSLERTASKQQKLPDHIVIGQHLIGQLYRDFPYIKTRIDQGIWQLPFNMPKHNLFEK